MIELPQVVSACLAGIRCRYDGRAKTDPVVVAEVDAGRAVPACPELLAGLTTPRWPAEIVGGDGDDVLDGRARVLDDAGADVTDQYVAGARRVLAIATAIGATRAVLQDRSPSCGSHQRYDGSFSGTLVDGLGVAAALLRRNGVTAVSPDLGGGVAGPVDQSTTGTDN